MQLDVSEFGRLGDGAAVRLFTLRNEAGMTARLTDFGALLVGLDVPDRQGRCVDVTLGFDTLEEWVGDASYFGATVGRYGNRIAGGRFRLSGRTYDLATNNGPNHLHGGRRGFNKVLWRARPRKLAGAAAVEFRYRSPDGEEGYPGTLDATVTYRLTADNALRIDHVARTDRPTVVNLVHHTYWNLAGQGRGTVLEHELTLAAEHYLPVDGGAIPTGEIRAVAGTAMDFSQPTAVGARIAQADNGGYDHNWVLDGPWGKLRPVGKLRDPGSGRVMHLATDQPGVQFYAGLFLNGSLRGKGGSTYAKHGGLCLETQRWPDSPNQPSFPSALLLPGQTYRHVMVHRFEAE